MINRSIYHKERVICYTIIARNEPYTYIHTYIHQYNTKRNRFESRVAQTERRGRRNRIPKKKTKTSRRRRPIPHHCRAAPILEELIVNLPTEKYSIQNLKQTKKKDNSKSPIVSPVTGIVGTNRRHHHHNTIWPNCCPCHCCHLMRASLFDPRLVPRAFLRFL